MNSNLEWRLALRNLLRNLRRTLSTATALIVAYVGIALLAGHCFKTERSLRAILIYVNQLGHVSIYKKGGIDHFEAKPDIYQVTEDELRIVGEVLKPLSEKIEFTSAFLSTPALLSTGNRTIPVLIRGEDPELENFILRHPFVRRYAVEMVPAHVEETLLDSVRKWPDAISIASGVAELLGRDAPLAEMEPSEKEMVIAGRTLEGDLNAVNATLALKHIVGLPYVEDTSVKGSMSLVRDLLQTQGASHQVLFLKDGNEARGIVARLQAEFDARRLELEALPFSDDRIGLYYNGTMSFLYVMVSFFSILILGASALIVVNSMTMSVLERTREIGTMRAFGFTPERVRSLFVKEAFCLAVLASLSGAAFSEAIASVLNSMGWTFEAAGVSMPVRLELMILPWFHLLLIVLMAAIATVCSYWIVTKKTKERIAVLLLESGAAI